MMNNLIYRVPCKGISGYKKFIEKTFSVLDKNFNLIFAPLNDDFCEQFATKDHITKDNFYSKELVISTIPLGRYESLVNKLPDKKNITFFTMWESSVLPKFAVEELNEIDASILVPSKWNEMVFKSSGVKNVSHCPLFVDDAVFKYTQKKDDSSFVFSAGACSASETGNSKRKNFEIIFSAFRKAFKGVKDVRLNFKISSGDKSKIGNILDDRISFTISHLTDKEISNFLSESDVFVSSSKAEGWGFFQIESLAVGRPVITPNFGGVKDFCTDENSFFVDFEEQLADGAWGKRGGLWANIKEDSLIEKMRLCYEQKDAIRNNRQKYSNGVIEKFSLFEYEKRLVSILSK